MAVETPSFLQHFLSPQLHSETQIQPKPIPFRKVGAWMRRFIRKTFSWKRDGIRFAKLSNAFQYTHVFSPHFATNFAFRFFEEISKRKEKAFFGHFFVNVQLLASAANAVYQPCASNCCF